jgi:hypothetical protein
MLTCVGKGRALIRVEPLVTVHGWSNESDGYVRALEHSWIGQLKRDNRLSIQWSNRQTTIVHGADMDGIIKHLDVCMEVAMRTAKQQMIARAEAASQANKIR